MDSRILLAQVPGGMLTNMENQLKEQGAADKMSAVLEEIPRVREDLGLIPLVTPTSQIVGTQSVLNVLTGERYKSIAKETAGILKGEYGATPAPVNQELQQRVLEDGQEPITCRPADLIEPEVDTLQQELERIASEKGLKLSNDVIEDVLIYAQFPQIGLKFLENRDNPDAFEPAPWLEPAAAAAPAVSEQPQAAASEAYQVTVNGKAYDVTVSSGGAVTSVAPAQPAPTAPAAAAPAASGKTQPVPAPLAGNIFKIMVAEGQSVAAGEVIMVMEAMKMETEIRSPAAGVVADLLVKEGDAVQVGQPLLNLS